MIILTLAVLSAVAGLPTSPATAPQMEMGGACPAEASKARSTLVRYLTGPAHAEERERYSIPEIAPGRIRVLTDEADAELCATFQQGIGQSVYGRDPYRLTYYAAGDYYFITITNEIPPESTLVARHFPSVVVLTRDLQPVNVTAATP